MRYSFNLEMNREGLAYAQRYEVNASYKDIGAVCDAIRYMRADNALKVLDDVISMKKPIPYRRHNKHMGARHELGGRKGAYPAKAAKEVRLTLLNAIANAANNAQNGDEMIVVHACGNKTHIERRQPSKGSLAWGRGMYGRSALMHSDLEYAKIEIILAGDSEEGLSKNMKYFISRKNVTQEPKGGAKIHAALPSKSKAIAPERARGKKEEAAAKAEKK